MKPVGTNVVLGSGHIYFDEFDTDGKLTGEVYIAETPGFEITVASESIIVESSDDQVAEIIADIQTKVTRTATLTVKSMSAKLISYFIGGDALRITGKANVTSDPINGGMGVTQERWYQIGQDTDRPSGERKIINLKIKTAAEPPVLAAIDDDYTADLETGRIYIIKGSIKIPDDTVITADFDKTDEHWDEITSTGGIQRGALRFIANNTVGENRDVYLPNATIKPNGSLAFKSRDTVQEAVFDIGISIPDAGGSAIYINGRPS